MKLSGLLNRYQKAPVHWYLVPRAQYFNQKNLGEFHSVLELMRQHQFLQPSEVKQSELKFSSGRKSEKKYRKWDRGTKLQIQRKMIEQGIIKPHKKNQSINDQLANLRNHFNLMEKLGFAYFNKHNHFFISDGGLEFLRSKRDEWSNVLEGQLVRLQFWNPSLKKRARTPYLDFKLFPYILTLKLLFSLKQNWLTPQEFILFLSTATRDKDFTEILNLIESFRKLNPKLRSKVLKTANPTFPAQANASVTLGLFGCTPTLQYKEGKLMLIDRKRAHKLVDSYGKKLRFIEYDSFEDWYNFIGRVEPLISESEIIEYYTEIGEKKKAERLLQDYKDDIPDVANLEEALQKYYQERLLEDVLERNPYLLEEGLRVVPNGRQYATEVGRIDLLCTDKSTNYVVVELKKDRASDKVLGQLLRYMGWVKVNLSPDKLVRGLIFGQDLVTSLKTAVVGLQSEYDNFVVLKELDLSIKARLK